MEEHRRPLTIALLHLELGFGGAERLMLDAALELTGRGHRAIVFTARNEAGRTFDAAAVRAMDIRVRAGGIPRQLAQRVRVPMAVLRMARLAAAARREQPAIDVVLCDLVPQAIPLIRRAIPSPLAFYCHFPDWLLAPPGGGPAYQLYRRGINALERRGMRACTRVLANSRYTLRHLRAVLPEDAGVPVDVVSPGIDVSRFAAVLPLNAGVGELVLLSLGRFHPDKNHVLAVDTLAALRARVTPDVWHRLRLVIAGGYDAEAVEQRRVFAALEIRATALDVADRVTLVRSPSESEALALLTRATLVVHTAPAEHFGIVPLEAMAAGRPVVAVNNGGPGETVRHRETGLLCDPSADAFADATAQLLADAGRARMMGEAGRAHVAAHFTRERFGDALEASVLRAAAGVRR